MHQSLAIVMANQNGMRFLPDCFRTLGATTPADVPVYVIDNASTDHSRDFLAGQRQVRLRPVAENLGFVHAANLGILEALDHGADAVILLNNDVRLASGWLEALLEPAQHNPSVGIVGIMQTDFAGNLSPRTKAILNQWHRGRAEQELPPADPPAILDTDWVEGSCMLIDRSVFETIGVLDPLFAPAYFEESDFCRRARSAGFRVQVHLGASIEHFGAGSSGGRDRQRQRNRLLERNYLLYQAASARTESELWGKLVWSIGYHAAASLISRRMTATDWLRIVADLPRRLPGLRAKFHRDRLGMPCPALGTAIPLSRAQLEYARRLPMTSTGSRFA